MVKIQGQLKPIYNNPKASPKLLTDLNNILTPMQNNLNDTISHLNYLIKMINKHCNNNLKASNVVVSPKVLDVPKLLSECGEAITENPTLKQFVKNFEDTVNKLNPLNARPEIKEYLTLGIDRNLRKVAKNTGRSLKYLKKPINRMELDRTG